MPAASPGLARVTISSPQRRVDVALPDAVPLAELLPELLRHAGVGLADDGERHGGWLLRRGDGTALSTTTGLAGQEVHDGAVLHLVPARASWPELEFDDVVDAIAAGARRQGVAWSPVATRAAALTGAGAGLAVALAATVRGGLPLPAAVAALVLLLTGTVASRAYGDALTGAVLAGFGLPFAAAFGWLATPPPAGAAARALLASTALLVASLLAGAGVAHLLRIFVAGATLGLLGAGGAFLAVHVRPAAAAAVVLAAVVAGVAGTPLLAIRLGKLPVPAVALPGDLTATGAGLGTPPDRAQVFAAVARTDEMLTGLLIGSALAAAASATVLIDSRDASGVVMVAVCGVALLLRARMFVTVRHRLPLLAAGGWCLAALALSTPPTAVVAAAVALVSGGVALAGARAAVRPLSPYAGRAADILDILCLVSVVPLACAVLGLYGLLT
ncbi:type VII secretion integral membrane protein EccD [Dactylosporangium aurantiacum]|uniref:Type VII secretion integral membrane protein EccD n=1 Tax=Dactylosporangium aurantiacum TaxID=35754 RepID=A0A9Q9ILP2_9ACTN|nr:type VII secretion integral membrane protein EccD [Dactylosporangium aurantiacum]MDG6100731.1 type VII secretion integral membrane protein EccD [Dactylosporangium aurantiacum]UWZ55200.1 type VII secretion integral membrane protein EccD [Dactylosporangium aurantiacum]